MRQLIADRGSDRVWLAPHIHVAQLCTRPGPLRRAGRRGGWGGYAAGAGNVAMGAGLRPTAKGVGKLPGSEVRGAALEPACGGLLGN